MSRLNDKLIFDYAQEKVARYQKEADVVRCTKRYSLRRHLAKLFAGLAQRLQPKLKSQESYNNPLPQMRRL